MIGEIIEIDGGNILVKNNNNLTNIANLYVKVYNSKILFVGEMQMVKFIYNGKTERKR